MTPDELKAFLEDLDAVCCKHDVWLWTYGCCGGVNLRRGENYLAMSISAGGELIQGRLPGPFGEEPGELVEIR